jgi:PHD/YefM family antitoxin component YafN of YafNO toxin-antitoxin module
MDDPEILFISSSELRQKLKWVQKKIDQGARFVVTNNSSIYILLINVDVMDGILLDGMTDIVGISDFRSVLGMVVEKFSEGVEAIYISKRNKTVMVCLPPSRINEIAPNMNLSKETKIYWIEGG